jgi:two-component system chemotaxis response regulator CheY
MKILIVEDDFTSRLLLQKLLAPYGECQIAVNGREAVTAFGQALTDGAPYGLVCLDIMMPELDGQAALKEMRAIEQAQGIYSSDGAKIIMTTALSDHKNIIGAFNELCDGYLVKPVTAASIDQVLREQGLAK